MSSGCLQTAGMHVADVHGGAERVRHLGGDLAHASLADDQHVLAGAHVDAPAHVDRDAGHPQQRRVAPVHRVGQSNEELVLRDDHVLDVVRHEPDAAEQDVADLESRDVGPHIGDLADVLVPQRRRQPGVGRRVVPRHQVVAFGAVGDAGEERSRPDLVAGRGRRLRPVVDENLLSDAVFPESGNERAQGRPSCVWTAPASRSQLQPAHWREYQRAVSGCRRLQPRTPIGRCVDKPESRPSNDSLVRRLHRSAATAADR